MSLERPDAGREGGSKRESLTLGAPGAPGSFPATITPVGRSVAYGARGRHRAHQASRVHGHGPTPPWSRLSPLSGAMEGSRSCAYAGHPEPGARQAWPTCRGRHQGQQPPRMAQRTGDRFPFWIQVPETPGRSNCPGVSLSTAPEAWLNCNAIPGNSIRPGAPGRN